MSQPNPACRSCGSTGLQSLSCLVQAPAGNIPSCPAGNFPLAFCTACSLVQRLQPMAQPDPGLRSAERAVSGRVKALAQQLIETRRLDGESLVLEAGSSDGSLLRHYRDAGIPILGFEPHREAGRIARQRHAIPTREVAWGKQPAEQLVVQGLVADVFHAHDVLNRTDDLNGFIRGIRRVLSDRGLAVLEVPHVRDTLDRASCGAVDTSSFFFSLTALCNCLLGYGLLLVDVECRAGGSLLLFAVPAAPGVWPGERVSDLLQAEDAWGVRSFETYAPLARRVLPLAA